jgi:hypothetical protein
MVKNKKKGSSKSQPANAQETQQTMLFTVRMDNKVLVNSKKCRMNFTQWISDPETAKQKHIPTDQREVAESRIEEFYNAFSQGNINADSVYVSL